MNKLLILLSFILILFVSCDGRERAHKSNAEVLKEHKLLDSFSEKVEYFPREYTEVVTDTILNNGFIVKIKTYSDMQNSILKEYKTDSISNKKYYREFISEVVISKDNKEIFNKRIDKQFFKNHHDKSLTELFNLFTLTNISLSESMLINNNKIALDVIYESVERNNLLTFKIKINGKGKILIEESIIFDL